ncbi:hypothetical protein [Methanocella sp. MCL-LM]|uniref:hypothetical protein n=1 Tax=Methanocella sp. MCL-LM TaxID=3412035 RepID=UPI003C792C54
MVQKIILKLIALTAVVLVSLATVQVAVAAEHAAASATPDVTIILGTMGHKVSGAMVKIDGAEVGKTDASGNLTLKEPLTGNHSVTVSMKGINETTVSADFTHKPVVVKVGPEKYTLKLTMHITDKNTKHGIEGVNVYNNKYLMGTTDANGDLVIDGFPQGLYLMSLEKPGYKTSSAVMVFFSAKAPQTFTMTPTAASTTH